MTTPNDNNTQEAASLHALGSGTHEQEPSVNSTSDAVGGGEREEKLCKPRKRQHCRLCGQRIAPGEPCKSWSGVEPGEGWWRSYAHPECYAQTEKEKWDYGDWESCYPGDMERPKVEGVAGERVDACEQSGAGSTTDPSSATREKTP